MPQTATIKSRPAAFRMMKAMQAEGLEWGEDYRQGARDALAELLEGGMDQLIDEHLERMAELGEADRRNGCYRRWLLTELGMIELHVPRTRTFSALKVVRAYARRAKHVDRMILAGFLLGLSTRKVAIALLPILGRPVSPATVSAVARQLDAAVAAFHRRPLKDIYRVLVLDGVVLRRKTGAGALARPVLVALGLRPDGKKEVIDFRLASAESAAQLGAVPGRSGAPRPRRRAPRDAVRRRRGWPARRLAHGLPRHPCPALLGTQDPQRPEQGPQARPGDGQGRPAPDHERRDAAPGALRRPPLRRSLGGPLPKALACLRADLDDLLTCFRYASLEERKRVRTTNAIERRFREIRRRTRPMGTFQDKTSMGRILFAVFMHENRNQGLATPFALTQTF
jgi:putative transposase